MNIFCSDAALRPSTEPKSSENSDFVAIFNCFVLEAQMELDNKLGYYGYLRVLKRSFPGSFVRTRSGTPPYPLLKLDEFSKNPIYPICTTPTLGGQDRDFC